MLHHYVRAMFRARSIIARSHVYSPFTQYRIGRFAESVFLPSSAVTHIFKCACSHDTAVYGEIIYSVIFDNSNLRLKNLIRKRNSTKNHINPSIQTTKPRWFTVSFVPLISERFTQFNSNEDRVSFFSLNKLHEFIKVHKDPLLHKILKAT